MDKDGTIDYATREVVGVFPTASALESAVEQLGIAGVDRAAISVLGTDARRPGRLDGLFRSAKMIEDDPQTRLASFVSHASRTEGEAIAIAFPAIIGGFGGAWAVAAAGGALVTAIGITVLGGAVGAGLGALLLNAVARHHAADIESQLAAGGLVLWVATPDEAAEQRALEVLQRCGGKLVHTHTIDRKWGVANTPLHDVEPDPFLVHDKR
jgi:GNAT superfamily N-acetyltransferase